MSTCLGDLIATMHAIATQAVHTDSGMATPSLRLSP